ncbi:MAG: SRPBCC family protein [Parvibaculales bacterium]
MASISVIDDAYIHAAPPAVYAVITDYARMNSWFAQCACTVEGDSPVHEGTLVRHAVGEKRVLTRFTRRIDKMLQNERIEESYIDGDLIGTGVWTFTPEGEGTRVAFDCRVKGNSLMSNFGLWLTGSRMHSKFYQDMFTDLNAHLSKQG